MASDREIGGSTGQAEDGTGAAMSRLAAIGNRTCLMALEATLQALPQGDGGYAAAAEEVRGIARRVLDTVHDRFPACPA